MKILPALEIPGEETSARVSREALRPVGWLSWGYVDESHRATPQEAYGGRPWTDHHRQYCVLPIVEVAQSRPALCDPLDYTVYGTLQATILEWVAYLFTRGSSQPRD